MKRRKRVILSTSVALALAVAGRGAHAANPTTADCLAANESALALGNQHKLRDERGKFLICSASSCPADVRAECIRRVGEVNVAIPTIVFEARDAAGSDLGSVRVTMDGEVLAERLEGTALSINPGLHTFAFETPGQPRLEKQLLIREGEKDRRERVTFGSTASAAVAPAGVAGQSAPGATLVGSPTSGPAGESPSGHLGSQRMLAIAGAGVGIIGLGLGIGFGLDARSKHDDAVQACPGQCADQHGVNLWNQAQSAGNVSTVTFIVGAAGLAGAAALWFTAKPESTSGSGTKVGLGPGTLQLRGSW